MDRRRFLKGAGLAGAALLGAHARPFRAGAAAPALLKTTAPPPNILVIMVDQLRYPQWFPNQSALDTMLPNLARLRAGAVSFGQHYTASNNCTPARAALLTGLYTHQTGCLMTSIKLPNSSTPTPTQTPGHSGTTLSLNPGFPTWGTALRRLGYNTNWYGKWHLSDSCDLEPYGFSGGTCPSPNGLPGQGLTVDPQITDQFTQWFQDHGATGPWCTTVSFVNPHDIAWYYRYSSLVTGENRPPSVFTSLPPNYETALDLYNKKKPRLQSALQETTASSFGFLPFRGGGYDVGWLDLLDLYMQLQQYVDQQIGSLLDTLEASPDVAARTIVIFTADHGEYGGSHGLRGKGGAAYDEAIRVPLYVKDPTGHTTRKTGVERAQLTSSVDLFPLLLTLASGGSAWRKDPAYAHLAGRLDMAAILRDPQAHGRPYILHATDENFVEGGANSSYTQNVPSHVIGYRTATAKLGVYSYWTNNSLDIRSSGQDVELYDYSTRGGRLEIENVAASNKALHDRLLRALVHDAIPRELRQPLPDSLRAAQKAGLQAYLASSNG